MVLLLIEPKRLQFTSHVTIEYAQEQNSYTEQILLNMDKK